MIGVDLFSGAGGMTLGAIQAGIKVKFAVEAETSAALTYAHNNPLIKLFNKDIRQLKDINLHRKKNEQLVIFGGPPCQGFSTSNQKTRTELNPNNWLFAEFIRIVKLLKPEWIVFENVKGFITTENGYFYEIVQKKIKNLGYTISPFILNSLNFGVPQKRERVFVICSINNIKIKEIRGGFNKVSVGEAISDLPILKNGANKNIEKYKCLATSKYAKNLRKSLNQCTNHFVSYNSEHIVKRYKYIPQGGNWQDIPAKLMKSYANRLNCHSGIYYRLKINEPSIVIGNYRKNMLVHPTQNRGLSVREAARLQSFPDNYVFHGSIGSQQQQVGNAVPPLLAKFVFKMILES